MNTILFDLDGTLLPIGQNEFIKTYFGELVERFSPFGYDKDALVSAIWAGTKAMVKNDGTTTNYEVFWDCFAGILGKDVLALESEFDDFYKTEFNEVKKLLPQGYSVRPLLNELKAMGYTLVLATNPIFPKVASVSRLSWIGANTSDFAYITTMENSRFCKPNSQYYEELFANIGKQPQDCLMVGNNVLEDMCVSSLGAEVFLLTTHLENENNGDISNYPQGDLRDLVKYIKERGTL